MISMPMLAQNKNIQKNINEILEKAFDDDQNVRDSIIILQKRNEINTVEYRHLSIEMTKLDSINQLKVFPILDKYGWLGKPKVSEKACRSFFYIIQHAKIDKQLKYYQQVMQAYRAKYISAFEYAIFVDRVNVKQNKFQQYATQTELDQLGNETLYPVIEINRLDDRLSKIGLEPSFVELSNLYTILNVCKDDKVLIFHIMNKNQTKGVSDVDIFINDKFVGKSNDKGLFQCKIVKKTQSINIALKKDNVKKEKKYVMKDSDDFSNLYIIWNE
ncbi:hypothetical protein Palpr_1338 [Paludibacter propionicigenes WB4]|uniref:Uncharacterized protein n=2 Tax=Paludibacter TaxID=346096 RepID=E4T440_PALPW|nr:hypothetical protein Palpr_1338 [Paludibacter propionicigenes WB4]